MRRDRRRDTTKLIIAFRSFAKAPKNQSVNAAYINNCCISEIHTKYINILRVKNVEILMLNLAVYIQGVPGGMCQTSGGCSLS